MPSIHVSHPNMSLREAILCRRKHQQPFDEIDENHLYRSGKKPTRRKSGKVGKLHSPRQKKDPPAWDETDVFCKIPVEELDQQGVFSVRDVIVADRPLYEFIPAADRRKMASTRRKNKQTQRVHNCENKRVAPEVETGTGSALDDWSNFLDLLLPNLCVAEQQEYFPRASSGFKTNAKPNKSIGVNGRESVGASFNNQNPSFDEGLHNVHNVHEHRRRAPSPMRQVTPPPVVYPIARYPSRLNNRHLVELRRLSLRKHLTFRPVQAE